MLRPLFRFYGAISLSTLRLNDRLNVLGHLRETGSDGYLAKENVLEVCGNLVACIVPSASRGLENCSVQLFQSCLCLGLGCVRRDKNWVLRELWRAGM